MTRKGGFARIKSALIRLSASSACYFFHQKFSIVKLPEKPDAGGQWNQTQQLLVADQQWQKEQPIIVSLPYAGTAGSAIARPVGEQSAFSVTG
jgi:hypothetical protein